jgi:fructose-1,6-bisphosphatase/inositol monophosphatase family enzyme
VLIVREAGGAVTNLEGGTIDIMIPDILATSSRKIGQELTDILN